MLQYQRQRSCFQVHKPVGPAKDMTHNGGIDARPMMAVLSMEEQWSSLKSLLEACEAKGHQVTFSRVGSNQVCDLTVEGHLISLLYAELNQDLTEEVVGQAVDDCFKSCTDRICFFLLLIRGGSYTKMERRMKEILQTHFGNEVFKYLMILSVEDSKVVDTLDDDLLDLITACDGRYCRITLSAASEGLLAMFKMVDNMLNEHETSGYTESMLAAARKRSTEASALDMLKQKIQQAEGRELSFRQLVGQREERRARELQELKEKQDGERQKEAAERRQHLTRKQSLEEALQSLAVQFQDPPSTDDELPKTSVILLGLSGGGKSSALSVILQRAGNQYSVSDSVVEEAQSTESCHRKEVLAAGRQLILVDTPELWDEDGVENLELVKDCLALALPGPHVFLLVLQVGRFTQGECDMLGHLQRIFGREFAEHAVILFVQFDCGRRGPQRINDYVAGAHPALQDLIRKCGSRYYELDITKSRNALSYPQVRDLLSGVNKLVASHGGHSVSIKRFSPEELMERRKQMETGLEENLL